MPTRRGKLLLLLPTVQTNVLCHTKGIAVIRVPDCLNQLPVMCCLFNLIKGFRRNILCHNTRQSVRHTVPVKIPPEIDQARPDRRITIRIPDQRIRTVFPFLYDIFCLHVVTDQIAYQMPLSLIERVMFLQQ